MAATVTVRESMAEAASERRRRALAALALVDDRLRDVGVTLELVRALIGDEDDADGTLLAGLRAEGVVVDDSEAGHVWVDCPGEVRLEDVPRGAHERLWRHLMEKARAAIEQRRNGSTALLDEFIDLHGRFLTSSQTRPPGTMALLVAQTLWNPFDMVRLQIGPQVREIAREATPPGRAFVLAWSVMGAVQHSELSIAHLMLEAMPQTPLVQLADVFARLQLGALRARDEAEVYFAEIIRCVSGLLGAGDLVVADVHAHIAQHAHMLGVEARIKHAVKSWDLTCVVLGATHKESMAACVRVVELHLSTTDRAKASVRAALSAMLDHFDRTPIKEHSVEPLQRLGLLCAELDDEQCWNTALATFGTALRLRGIAKEWGQVPRPFRRDGDVVLMSGERSALVKADALQTCTYSFGWITPERLLMHQLTACLPFCKTPSERAYVHARLGAVSHAQPARDEHIDAFWDVVRAHPEWRLELSPVVCDLYKAMAGRLVASEPRAASLMLRRLAIYRVLYGKRREELADAYEQTADMLLARPPHPGRAVTSMLRAERLRFTLRGCEATFGMSHAFTHTVAFDLARALWVAGRRAEALWTLERALSASSVRANNRHGRANLRYHLRLWRSIVQADAP